MTYEQHVKLDEEMAHLFNHAPGHPKPSPRNPFFAQAQAARSAKG